MYTYFVAYVFQKLNSRIGRGETIVQLKRPVSTKDDLEEIKASVVHELAETNDTVLQPEINLVSVQHLHSRP